MLCEYSIRISHNVEELESVVTFTNTHIAKRLQEKDEVK